MKIVVVSGSNRLNSQSLKIAKIIRHKLAKSGHNASLIDLHETNLPLFGGETHGKWLEISDIIEEADGFVWITPEWDGMVPPAMYNFIAHAGREMAHKPVLLAAVSSGVGGAYPIASLKAFGGKNRHYVLVPEQLIFREVKNVFSSPVPDENNQRDIDMHRRTDYALKVLASFSKHLHAARKDLGEELTLYPTGM